MSAPISAHRTRTSTGGRPAPANEVGGADEPSVGIGELRADLQARGPDAEESRAPLCRRKLEQVGADVVSTATLPAADVARLMCARAPKASA